MERGGPYDLDVEVTLAQDPLRRLADGGEGLDLEVLQGLPRLGTLSEFCCTGFQVVVGERLKPGLRLVDCGDDALELPEGLAFSGAKDLGEDWH